MRRRPTYNLHSDYALTASWSRGLWSSPSSLPMDTWTEENDEELEVEPEPEEDYSYSWSLGIQNAEWRAITIASWAYMSEGVWHTDAEVEADEEE